MLLSRYAVAGGPRYNERTGASTTMPTPTQPVPKAPIPTPTQGANPNATTNQYGNPVNPYDATHAMPTIDGTPIGAFGAQWGGSGYQYDPSTNPRAQQWMQWMQQSDPTARWQQSEVGGQNQWNFTQDRPGAEGVYPQLQQSLKPFGGGMTQERVFEHNDFVHPDSQRYATPIGLKDPNMLIKTPFGRITPEANMNHPRDLVGQFGPMIISAIATMMSGGAASPMLMAVMNGIGSGALSGNPTGLLTRLGLGAMGAPSWLSSLGSTAATQFTRHGPRG